MDAAEPFTAFSRFGLGTRPGDLTGLSGDPEAALAAEIARPADLLLDDAGLPDSVAAYAQIRAFQLARAVAKNPDAANQRKALDALFAAIGDGAIPLAPGARAAQIVPAAVVGANGRVSVPGVLAPHDMMLNEIAARAARIRQVPIGFGERLVAFWANHFAVQAGVNEVVAGLAGAFEREAIRPHVLGRFHDMLVAVSRHPAMLVSLNNNTSIGPDSPQGRRSGRGLNENLGREMMELHTIGVDAGYTQADVTTFSKVLTGWTFGTNPRQPRQFGRFTFRRQAHEPGAQTIMGRLYGEPGENQALAVMADLASSPDTARHLATQLARHFVADTPDPGLVDTLASTYTRTDGDLGAVSRALIAAPEAWSAPVGKLKTPQDYVWSAIRALKLSVRPQLVVRMLADLGQPLWNPPSPQGYKDDVATWLAPDAMTVRLDAAERMASQARSVRDPRVLAADLFGPALSSDTAEAIARAESPDQGLALLLMSPEFQRS